MAGLGPVAVAHSLEKRITAGRSIDLRSGHFEIEHSHLVVPKTFLFQPYFLFFGQFNATIPLQNKKTARWNGVMV